MARGNKKTAAAPPKWRDVPEIPKEEQPYPLPEGWKWVRLGDVVTISKETKDVFKGEIYIGLEHIEKGGVLASYGDSGHLKSLKNVFHENAILYGKLRPYLNKHCVVDFDGVCSTDICVFYAKNIVVNKFVDLYFNTDLFIENAVKNSRGINLPRVSPKEVLRTPFPYPRVETQKSIAVRIESLFSQLDAAAEKVQTVIESHEARKQAILHQAFSGELTRDVEIPDTKPYKDISEIPKEERPYPLPEGWKWAYLGDAVELLRGVTYSKRDAHKEQMPDDCLILRGGNIKEGYIDLYDDDNVYVDKSLVKKAQLVRENDVLIVSSTGSIKVIGRAGISDMTYKDVAFGAFLTLARPNNKYCERYVNYFFQSDMYRNRIKSLVGGININNIKKDYISLAPFPCPPLKTQEYIVKILTPVLSHLDSLTRLAANALEEIKQLKQSILNKAFRGELA